jgi:DnaJ-domain-containing protein 1
MTVGLRYWKRMRAQVDHHADGSPVDAPNPWRDPEHTLSQLGGSFAPTDDARAERYSEWAERMRQRRRPAGGPGATEPDGAAATAGYWSSEALFEDSRRLEQEEPRPNPWRVRELLAVFDLTEGATPAQIGTAYRRLAKQHHPDRYISADPDTQAFHADRMRHIIDAYRELKQLQTA